MLAVCGGAIQEIPSRHPLPTDKIWSNGNPKQGGIQVTTKKSFESTAGELSKKFINPILRKQVAEIVARIFA